MEKIALVVLAAGMGKRMGSELPKVAIRTREKAIIQHVLEYCSPLKSEKIIVVLGHKREIVEKSIADGQTLGFYDTKNVHIAVQAEPKGTGDAVKAAIPDLKNFVGTILIICGDAPLLRTQTLQNLLAFHQSTKSTVSILSFIENRPNMYGRLVRNAQTGLIEKIVETKDASPQEQAICECNSSIYAVDSAFLFPAINQLKSENVQGEYYFTDVVAQAVREGQKVSALVVADASETFGVNTLLDLSLINQALNRRKVEELINSGVTIEDPASVYIDASVEIDSGVQIGPQVKLLGKTRIAAGAKIEGSAYLKDCLIDQEALIKFGVRAENSHIGRKASIGPFANLREGTDVGSEARVGNFVETKKTKIGEHAKAPHLTYLGDCEVGANANIGAGTITCNYDGISKHPTKIGEGAFIGSNSCLVAPMEVGAGAIVGAGSVINKTNVPAKALAVSRAPLTIRENWASRKEKK